MSAKETIVMGMDVAKPNTRELSCLIVTKHIDGGFAEVLHTFGTHDPDRFMAEVERIKELYVNIKIVEEV